MIDGSQNLKVKAIRTPQKTNRRNLAIGSILIIASAIGVWWTIQANNHTDEFLVSVAPASSGSSVTESSFRAVKMNLGSSGKLYLKPGDLPKSAYLLVTVDAGQLVPKSSLANSIIDAREPVVITSKMPLPAKVKVGDFVDVWVSKSTANNKFQPPTKIVLDAEIVDIVQSSGIMSDQAQQIQVLVPTDSVASILDAIASKDALSLVLQRNLGDD